MSRFTPPEYPESELDLATRLDPIFKNQIDRLYHLSNYGRWLTLGLLWLTVGAYSLYELRYPIGLLQEYFTWAALKYGLVFQPIPALGLCLCIGMTASALVRQSLNSIWGISKLERQRLSQQVAQIRKQGSSHPLWKWVVRSVDS
ncbi:hypothetical protein [Chamaesiphon sp.]|uniref:hypothetical protein n=1 Tax=Chamaesiphon sp. TaxID=2814140 RepID=UPI003593E27D